MHFTAVWTMCPHKKNNNFRDNIYGQVECMNKIVNDNNYYFDIIRENIKKYRKKN